MVAIEQQAEEMQQAVYYFIFILKDEFGTMDKLLIWDQRREPAWSPTTPQGVRQGSCPGEPFTLKFFSYCRCHDVEADVLDGRVEPGLRVPVDDF